jgi:hypothetical protein
MKMEQTSARDFKFHIWFNNPPKARAIVRLLDRIHLSYLGFELVGVSP